MKSTAGGVTRFNRWYSPPTDRDEDPWMDLAQATDDAEEVKMAFDDDFHLTVIPNFLHDSDAYIANLEDRLERLQQVNLNPSPSEILTTMMQARTLRMKNAELNPELNAKPPDDTGDVDDTGLLAMWPALFALVSRRLFPRLPLTKEETQHLLKFDYLLAQHQDQINNNDTGNNEAEGHEIQDADTVPDTSWERRDRDSSHEQPPVVESPYQELSYLRFESPEAHEIQIPKNWDCDEARQEVQQDIPPVPEDTTPVPQYSTNECPKVNRSASSLLANTNPITQEASTVTSFTPTKRSEEAFYHFAYIKTSMTTTQDSVRVGTPSEYPARSAHADSHSKSKSALHDQISLIAASNVNLTENQYDSSVDDSDEKEAKAVSKSSGNVTEVTSKDQSILMTKSSPSLKPARDTEVKEMSLTEGDKDEAPRGMGEDERHRQSESIKSQTQLPTTEDEVVHGSDTSSSPQMVTCKAVLNMIVPEVAVASSSTQESIFVQERQCKREEDKISLVMTGHSIHGTDITVPEVMVASSSTHESMAAGFEGPWFDKESEMSLDNPGEDLLQHMSSLVRASVDEDEPPRVNGNQTSQLSGGCTQLSSTGVCCDRTKASEGTSGNYTTNYSDPHSNLFEEDSSVKKDEGQAPIIRMYGHMGLQGNLRLWPQPRGIDHSRDSLEQFSSRPLPQVKRNTAEGTSAITCKDNLSNTIEQHEKSASTTSWQYARNKSNQSEENQTAPKMPVIMDTDCCRKVPSAKSEYWSSRSRSSASSVESSAVTPTKSATEETSMKASASKLSTSSMFKSRERSVHWFQTIEDVDSDTVVKDCDYLSMNPLETKVPTEYGMGQHTINGKSVASKKASERDHSEGSRVKEICKKFTANVLEEEGIVASKVYSFPEFFETSRSKEHSTMRSELDIVIIAKDDKSTAVECVECSESFDTQSEAKGFLKAPRDSTVASESEENAAVYAARCPEPYEGQDEKGTVPKTTASSDAVENDVINSVVDSARLSESTEVPFNKDSSTGSQEHLGGIAEAKMQAADEPEMIVVCQYQFTAVPNNEQNREAVETKQEPLTTAKACQEHGSHPKCVDKETQVVLDSDNEQAGQDMQARTNSPSVCQRCSPKPPPRNDKGTTQSMAIKNEPDNLPSDAGASPIKYDCDDKMSTKSKKDKQEPAEGEERSNDEASYSKGTTVLQCHELVTATRFTRFPASNRNGAANQRSLNMTRALRITTTNQFKPLNLRHSTAGGLGNSSSFIGRPLSIQSREVVPPKALPPQHRDGGRKAPKEQEDGAAPCLEPVRSSSCRDIAEAINTEPSATALLLAHRSRSFHGAVSEESDGLKKVSSEIPADAFTHRTDNGGHLEATPEGTVASGNVPVNDALNTNKGSDSSFQAEAAVMSEGCKVQLPLKKHMCCRLAQSAEKLGTQETLNKDNASHRSVSVHDAENHTAHEAGSATDVETRGCDEVTARQGVAMLVAEAALKLDNDNVFLNEEHTIQGVQVDRTLSLIADSQYSTVGAMEISHASPISAVLGGDMTGDTAKHCASMPSACDCTISTASKDDTPLNESLNASTMPPEEAALAANDGTSATINAECLTMPVGKPAPLQRRKRGGEKDADTDEDSSWTDLSVVTEADEDSQPSSQLGTNTLDEQCLLGESST